ncbi:MAG TPA: response regulator transcription factor [Roseiarcus sp.]|nr:response regulator transcription factor [Roseiarcus sp.]
MIGELLTPEDSAIQDLAEQTLLIVSEVRLLREGIAGTIEGKSRLSVVELCENLDQALSAVRDHPAATVLFDASFSKGFDALRDIRSVNPSARVVVFAVSETEENVIAWARAGAAGYIPTTAGLHELVRFIECIIRGEQICSTVIASKLIQWVGSIPGAANERSLPSAMSLTTREQEIVRMIAEGLSNKEIARRLKIELSTTKSHVHNLLGKLGLRRRGQVTHWALAQGHLF